MDNEDDDFDVTVVECPSCDGEGQPLGRLGQTDQYRCRSCGYTFPAGASSETFRSDGSALALGDVLRTPGSKPFASGPLTRDEYAARSRVEQPPSRKKRFT